MMIPSGLIVTLARGNEVETTHRLGGNFTVVGIFGMARIEGKDADALGLQPASPCQTAAKRLLPKETGSDGKRYLGYRAHRVRP